jgi:short-subunit dehydrogenase
MNILARTALTSIVVTLASIKAARLLRDSYSFEGKAILITGARGLALILARMLAEEGARLTLVARNPAELQRAADELRAMNGTVFTYAADLRIPTNAEAAVQAAFAQYGQLDVLINSAGIIQGGPLEHMRREDYEEALAIHFWAPLYTMEAALPHMKQQGAGRIVNIASIGGLVAIPHLAPYSASKFALVGLSDAWRDELAKDGIQITTVCPGLMRTGSQYNTGIKGQHQKELALFATIQSSPFVSVDARGAARQIIEACRRGDARLVISFQARLLALADTLFPELTADLKALAVGLLPGPTGPDGDRLQSGWHSQSRLAPSFLTRWIDEAATRNNEHRAQN